MKVLAVTGLIAGLAFILPNPAAADVHFGVGIRVSDGYRNDYRDTRRLGFDRGFEEGYREGVKDARRGERFSFWDEGRYRDSDRGYHNGYGPRWEYRNGYKSGFESGYRRGYEASRPHYDRRDGNDRDRYDDRYRR